MLRYAFLGLCLVILPGVLAASATAADPAFVGDLALAVEPEVAQELGLSDDTKTKLLTLIDARENEAVSLALEIKNLSPEERREKLAPFVAESEKQGFALLTEDQQRRLKQLRIARGGLSTLQESAVADAVGLSLTQQEQVTTLLGDLKEKLASGTEAERRIAKAEAERRLAQVLTKEQRATWDKLAGISTGEAPATPMPDATAKENAPAKEEKPADAQAMADKPAAATPKEPAPETSNRTRRTTAPKNPDDVRLTFNFRYTPWKDVLDWFATQADLSLVMDAPPQGTFNYSDTRSYTPAQAIDLLNSVLLTKGYTLVRRDRMLLLINLEDGIPPNLVPQVSAEDLDKKGEYELVGCLFTVTKVSPEELEPDIRKLIGPQGSLVVLPKAKQIYVTETAGKLRTIRSIIEAVENPSSGKDDKIASFKLENVMPDEVMAVARPLLGIPENLTATPDGSLRIAIDSLNGRFLVSGKAERVEKFGEIIKMVDVKTESGEVATMIETPQLEVYTVTTADPDAVLQVLRTLLAGLPDVRLDKDAKTGNIVAHARPSQHATIRATIDQMQKDARQVEVIKLRKLDPQVAVIAINKLFGVSGEGAANPSAPNVDADPTSMQLLIRGSVSQIEQIRDLLAKLGESPADSEAALAERSNVRMIPLTGRAATSALDQIESLWPSVRTNRIRVVTPSGGSGEATTDPTTGKMTIRVPVPKGFEQPRRSSSAPRADSRPTPPASDQTPAEGNRNDEGRRERDRDDRPREDRSTGVIRAPMHFVVWQENAEVGTPAASQPAKPQDDAPKPAEEAKDDAKQEPPKQKSVPGAEIVVTVGPGGIVIASEDLDALDEFEEMLQGVASQTASSGKEYTIFYLRYAKADLATELLQQALGGGGGGSDSGGDGGLMGDIASSMLGGMGGGLLGGLMGGGGGGGSVSSGPVMLVPDNRLNAIIAQGRPADLDMAEQLLKIIDQESSPEDVQTVAKPRFIPVVNTTAAEMATVVRQVYSGRIAADANQPRQPSPEELIRALRGGRGGGGGGRGNDRKSEEQKMTIGVDERSNSLIVSAPDPLFQEVKLMVEQLDVAGSQKDEAIRVVSLKGTNPQLVEQALNSMVGNVTINRQGTDSSNRGNRGQGSRSSSQPQQPQQAQFQPSPQQMQDEIRRRIESFNQFQQRGGRGGRGGRGR